MGECPPSGVLAYDEGDRSTLTVEFWDRDDPERGDEPRVNVTAEAESLLTRGTAMSSPRPPVFILDSREQWRPEPVEQSLVAYGYRWIDNEWVRDGKPVTIDRPAARHSARHRPPRRRLPPDRQRVPLDWHQYWTWWRYNPKTYAGKGAHEGDWEFVQIGCRPMACRC
jgi:hypothetical protein